MITLAPLFLYCGEKQVSPFVFCLLILVYSNKPQGGADHQGNIESRADFRKNSGTVLVPPVGELGKLP